LAELGRTLSVDASASAVHAARVLYAECRFG
jgi:hypothetical protein